MTAEMRQLQLSDVKDLQYMEAVLGLLNKGIVSISNICKCLLDAQVDQKTGICSNYEQIRGHIEDAEQGLEKSASMIEEKLGYLDECMERLIEEKENAEQQNKKKCMAQNKLHAEKNSAEESLKNSKAALEQAKKCVETAKHALRRHQDRKSTGEEVAVVGAAVLPIPLIGWIAGLIMLCEGDRLIKQASKDIRDAEDELKKNESQVNEKSNKVSNYQSMISSTQNKIKEMDEVLQKIQRKTEELKQLLEVTADVHEIVRRAVNLLSVLRGSITVLERQTQHFILWDPVIKVMEDVIKAAENVGKNELLYNQGVPGLINTLKETVGVLQASCNSASISEYDSYTDLKEECTLTTLHTEEGQ